MQFDSNYELSINGELFDCEEQFDVINPATGKAFATAPNCSEQQLDQAVDAARLAFKQWRKIDIEHRANLLNQAAKKLHQHAAEMATLFTQEQGRPLAFAQAEIEGAAVWLQAVANMRPPMHRVEDENQIIETHYQPLGVVCAITPWNFPVSLAIWKIAPALLAGNTMVLKPSPFTPLCSLKMGELFNEVFPKGVLNIISGDDSLGPKMTSHSGFDKISFTGSTATGKRVMESAASDLKRLTLELGGNDAAIVMPDVDVAKVANKLFRSAFFNSAQICVATKRLYAHEAIYDELRDHLIAIAKQIKIADGLDPESTMGPLQNQRQYQRVMALLDDAKQQQLIMHYGNKVPEQGYFAPITIVDNPPEESAVVQEEAFGPILPMLKFSDVNEVIERVNNSEYGLAGSVWSDNIEQAKEIASQLETGTVWINHSLNIRPDVVFGGHKNSGFGAEHGTDGLLEYMIPQAIHVAKA